jgi:hypothetical protein
VGQRRRCSGSVATTAARVSHGGPSIADHHRAAGKRRGNRVFLHSTTTSCCGEAHAEKVSGVPNTFFLPHSPTQGFACVAHAQQAHVLCSCVLLARSSSRAKSRFAVHDLNPRAHPRCSNVAHPTRLLVAVHFRKTCTRGEPSIPSPNHNHRDSFTHLLP